MRLSVVIVNYNVRYFLEQALVSVRKAMERVQGEVFVVDNNSQDGSVEMVARLFPEVKLIANPKNVGFSTANNQAIRLSQGDYVLLLNPDTVVAEDTFERVVDFMDAHQEAGGLGVKMIDGSGEFLPESKRGFPSPSVAFYKTFGFSSLFPRSQRFNRYHLGYLDKNQTHEVDVLSGAFMLLRKTTLDKIGLLDETFFMYGEDIDLSYRIVQAGYKNYYFADTCIIHYKGESTKKGSLNYVKTFYQAMIIFAEKHFRDRTGTWALILMLRLAIYFRAFITLFGAWIRAFSQPLVDALVIFGGLWVLKDIWAVSHFKDPNYFPTTLLYINFPIYIIIWLAGVYLRGGYDRGSRYTAVLGGLFVSTVVVAALYGFLPTELRYSRMLIILGMIWAMVGMAAVRIFINIVRYKSLFYNNLQTRNLAIVGEHTEAERVRGLLHNLQIEMNFVGIISPETNTQPNYQTYLGTIAQLAGLVQAYKLNELIFCGKNLAFLQIITAMSQKFPHLQYKIVAPESEHIVGSNSKNTAGDIYTLDIRFRINHPTHKRNKRLFDMVLAGLGILLCPIFWVFVEQKKHFLVNCWDVLLGKASWVGYYRKDTALSQFPPLAKGIFSPLDAISLRTDLSDEAHTLHRLNLYYAKDYHLYQDLDIVLRNLKHLGRKADF